VWAAVLVIGVRYWHARHGAALAPTIGAGGAQRGGGSAGMSRDGTGRGVKPGHNDGGWLGQGQALDRSFAGEARSAHPLEGPGGDGDGGGPRRYHFPAIAGTFAGSAALEGNERAKAGWDGGLEGLFDSGPGTLVDALPSVSVCISSCKPMSDEKVEHVVAWALAAAGQLPFGELCARGRREQAVRSFSRANLKEVAVMQVRGALTTPQHTN
jgi:hypothetical protein